MSHIKLGYSTYAMRDLDVRDALPRLRAIGYEAIEIMGEDGWTTSPAVIGSEERKEIGRIIQDVGFDLSAVMMRLPLCEEEDGYPEMLDQFRAVCGLARDLCFEAESVVVSSPLGCSHLSWEGGRERIAASLIDMAEIANEHGVILAVEPHVGSVLDSPEKAVWLMEQTGHPALKLNFDISHFHVHAMNLRRCIDLCLSHAAHIHIKDGYHDGDGKVVFQLPGEGSLDLHEYFRLLSERSVAIPVTAEVSAMIWKRPDYDPWAAAERSYAALVGARDSLI